MVEDEAAYLSGCILIPNDAAYRIAFSGVDVQSNAEAYGVNEEMIRYRLRMSGALKRDRRFAKLSTCVKALNIPAVYEAVKDDSSSKVVLMPLFQ